MRLSRLVAFIIVSSAAYLLVTAACNVGVVPPTIPPDEPGGRPVPPVPGAPVVFLSADRTILIRDDQEAGHATLTVATDREATYVWELVPDDLLRISPDTPLAGANAGPQLVITGVARDPKSTGTRVTVTVVVTEQIGCPECVDGESATEQLTLEVRRAEPPLMVPFVAVEGTSMQPASEKHLKALISAGRPFVDAGGKCNVPDGAIEPADNTNGKPYCVNWRVIENLSPTPEQPLSERLSALALRPGDVTKQENDADTVAELVYKSPAANGNATFQLTVVDAAGPSLQREVTVEILSQGAGQVTLAASADHPDLCTGETATITATAEGGTGDNTFTFSLVGESLAGESLRASGANATYTPPTSAAVTRTIRVTVREAGGSSDQTSVVITTIVASSCDDGNVCTSDACKFGACSHTNVSGPCDDRSACTTGDTCSNGRCGGTTVTCNDGNPCTNDFCEPSIGCQYPYNTSSCNDGNACTTGDACSGGVCVGGPALNCDDGNPCTDDSCSATGCQHSNNTAACNDGNACTTGDTCSGGVCSGTGVNCDDGNVCTTDFCESVAGCQHLNNTNPCSDGNVCTTVDTCSGGVCVGGPALNCNDANPCTDDSCNTVTGCQHVDNTAACDDGLFCNGADTCAGGTCGHAGNPCTPPDLCDDGLDACVECLTAAECNDSNICTTDACASGVCVNVPNTGPCNDGQFCNGADTCSGGTCSVHAGDPCTPPDLCDEATNACVECLVDADCADDGNVCTDESCDASLSCQHVDNNAACDDGEFCNGADTCSGGACSAHAGDPCAAPDVCDEGGDQCVECLNNGDCGGATPFCDTGSHTCVECANAGQCDDTVGCTDDTCVAGTCVYTPDNANCPDDGSYCNGVESCDPVNDCVSSGDPCLPGEFCNEATDTCDQCLVDGHCNDGVGCTDDACAGGICTFTENNANCPDDGLFCNGTEFCDAVLDCQSTGDPCPPGLTCAEPDSCL